VTAVPADGLPAAVETGRGPDLPAPAAGKGPGLAPAPGAKAQSLDRDAEVPLPAAARVGGSATAAAPARSSAPMSRRTPRKGARVPLTVSSPGWPVTAAAMRRRPSGRAAAWPSAPRTASGLSAGSSSAIRASRAPRCIGRRASLHLVKDGRSPTRRKASPGCRRQPATPCWASAEAYPACPTRPLPSRRCPAGRGASLGHSLTLAAVAE
jgi:hypothetical protein